MTTLRLIALALVFAWGLAQPALADKRVALVVGNGGYQNVPRLQNPANDADAMATILKNAGFDIVESRRDLGMSEMRRALRDFADKTRDADIAVVYYAGHGIEVDGTNYVIPVDAALERDLDIYDEAFPLDRILAVVEPAKKLRLVILDACRDNPFAKTMKRTASSRSIGRGLSRVEPASPNTLIAFAAKAGSTASDGSAKNSPFTTALVKHIVTPGLDLRKAFGFVRDDVMTATGNRQEPYVYGSLGGNDVPLIDAKPVVVPAPINPNLEVRRDYELALEVGTREVWTAFIAQYPSGLYATLAKGQLNKIAAEEARIAATEKARLAQEDKARLAAEGAREAEQKKAAALAEAAERAKAEAERAKQIEQDKATAAEAARAERERVASEKAAAARAEAEKLAATKLAAEQAAADKRAADKLAAETAAKEATIKQQQVASLPPDAPDAKPEENPLDLARLIQSELRRVGCFSGTVNGEWNFSAKRSLERFNKSAGLKLDVKLASVDALDAIKLKPSRICPLECERGFRASGESCVKITCAVGSFVNEDNECEKKLKKTAMRNPVPARSSQKPTLSQPAEPKRVRGYAGCNLPGNVMSGGIPCNF